MITKTELFGSPYIGVYCIATDYFLLVPETLTKYVRTQISNELNVKCMALNIGGSTIIGSLVCANSSGALVTNFITDTELKRLSAIVPAVRIRDKLNAMGNNVLVNDFGAVVHPDFENKSIAQLEDILDVEVVKSTIAGIKTVGMAAVATNKGILSHPHTSEQEMNLLRDVLKVPVKIGTLNYGTPLLGACMVANKYGAVVGSRTTPVEMGRVMEALGFIE